MWRNGWSGGCSILNSMFESSKKTTFLSWLCFFGILFIIKAIFLCPPFLSVFLLMGGYLIIYLISFSETFIIFPYIKTNYVNNNPFETCTCTGDLLSFKIVSFVFTSWVQLPFNSYHYTCSIMDYRACSLLCHTALYRLLL